MRVSSVIAMPANTDKYRLSVLSLEKIVWEFWQVNLVDCVMNFIVLSLSKVQEHKGVLRIERSLLERHLSHWSHRGWMVNSSMPTIVHVHSHDASPGSAHCPWHSFWNFCPELPMTPSPSWWRGEPGRPRPCAGEVVPMDSRALSVTLW